MAQLLGKACGPHLSTLLLFFSYCGLPVPGKRFVRRSSLCFFKENNSKRHFPKFIFPYEREKSKTFATKQEDQTIVFTQVSQEGRRRGLD